MTGFKASPQQGAAIDWAENGTGNGVLIAVAGAGKTTTILKMAEAAQKRTAIVAYNKAIAVEIEGKIEKMGLRKVKAGTVHSFGMKAVGRAFKVKVNASKVANIFDRLRLASEFRSPVVKLVGIAKNHGVGVLEENDSRTWADLVDHYNVDFPVAQDKPRWQGMMQLIELSQQVLAESNKDTKTIDFDDMVYFPLLFDLELDTYDFVYLDEAQDTNATRRALVKRMVEKRGRFCAVGDPAQAIYGFTGADSDALQLIQQEFAARELPLTVSFRCPKAVVEVARNWVSHIEAHDGAAEGSYNYIEYDEFLSRNLENTDAVLCRKNAPLLTLAYSLIKRGVACKVEGKDIGYGLIKLVKKWKTPKVVGELIDKVSEYEAREVARVTREGKEHLVGQIEDQCACVVSLCNMMSDDAPIKDLVKMIEDIFDTEGSKKGQLLTLASIHRSKGREWQRVYWLGREAYQPSPYARRDWQLRQEDNLCYVAATRAMSELIEVEAPTSKKESGS
jgi:superfamily I DNA/RNA helicase